MEYTNVADQIEDWATGPDADKGGAGPLRTHNVCTFESEAGGTRVTVTDDIELSGVFGLLEPLMGRVVRRGYEANLGRLKAILEAQLTTGA